MARITDRFLVQRVDEVVVFMDDSTGEEVTLPVEVVPNLIAALAYLIAGLGPSMRTRVRLPEGHVLVALITQRPEDEGASYTVTYGNGDCREVGDAQSAYWTLARGIDDAYEQGD